MSEGPREGDLLIICDTNLRHQQNLAARRILELRTNHRPTLERYWSLIRRLLKQRARAGIAPLLQQRREDLLLCNDRRNEKSRPVRERLVRRNVQGLIPFCVRHRLLFLRVRRSFGNAFPQGIA